MDFHMGNIGRLLRPLQFCYSLRNHIIRKPNVAEEKKKGPILLITAFEPFDGAKTNSSLILLEKLQEEDWGGRVVFFGPVPVSFDDAWPIIQQEMKRHPDLQGVLALGQAGGRPCLSLERRAVNWTDAHIPDNYGVLPRHCRVEEGEPKTLWSTFPWNELEKSKNWECSYFAGNYLCNEIMYRLVNWSLKEEGKTAGFVHIPLLESQGADPALGKHSPRMKDDAAADSLRRIINFSLETLEARMEAKPKPAVKRLPFRRIGGHAPDFGK